MGYAIVTFKLQVVGRDGPATRAEERYEIAHDERGLRLRVAPNLEFDGETDLDRPLSNQRTSSRGR